ncbi:MAG TPA: xanthine dehydrogenase family protein subunit M [Burkholderiales bacterium]|nr:xanthine dehydrogenase family protein subunit M [Burkholderiales bacterium]
MKPPRFTYHCPGSLGEALDLLATLPNARPLAGGQSLMPMLNFRLASPDHLVDLNALEELAFIREDGDAVVIGALTRQRDIENSALVARRLPLMAEAIRLVGHRQTRNRGTLGGSLAHFDPSAELPAVATALDAEVRIASKRGERTLGMAQFGRGLLSTALESDEIVTEVRLPAWPQGHGHGFQEFARRHGDFAVVSAAALVVRSKGAVTRASLTLGGIAPAPLRMAQAEAILQARGTLAQAAEACGSIEALGDATYPAWYRRKLAVSLARRALEQAMGRAAS